MPVLSLALTEEQYEEIRQTLGHFSPVNDAVDFFGHEVGQAVATALSLPRIEGQSRLSIRTCLSPEFAKGLGCAATHEVVVDVPRARG